MTAPTVAPLYDQALEELLDGDVMCAGGDSLAVAVVHLDPCGHEVLVCVKHLSASDVTWERYELLGWEATCRACDAVLTGRIVRPL